MVPGGIIHWTKAEKREQTRQNAQKVAKGRPIAATRCRRLRLRRFTKAVLICQPQVTNTCSTAAVVPNTTRRVISMSRRRRDEVVRHPLAVKDGAKRLQKIAATHDAEQLAPAPPIGMAVGAQVAPAHPAPVGTGRVGAELGGGVDLTVASSRHDKPRGRSGRSLQVGVGSLLTRVAVRLYREARKGLEFTLTLGPSGGGFRCQWVRSSGVAGPYPMKHEAQPHQDNQPQLVENEIGDHDIPLPQMVKERYCTRF
jgi:hypothetical protein